MRIADFSNDTVEPELKRFSIDFEQVGTNSCLIIDFGTRMDTNFEAYGDLDSCVELFPESRYVWMGNLTNPLELARPYGKPRDYVLRFSVANQISKEEIRMTITVIEIDCKPPETYIRNRVTNYRRGSEFWRSKAVQLFSKTNVDCNATTIVTRLWSGYLIDPENGTVIDVVDLSGLDSYRKSFLYVPPFTLMPGTYRFVYSINMTSPDPHPLLPFFASSDTYVTVVPSPIFAQLTEGAQSRGKLLTLFVPHTCCSVAESRILTVVSTW